MITLAKAMLSRLVEGALRFGLDRLGGREAGGQLPLSAHPYGLRSRPRDADVDEAGEPTRGAELLVFDLGGGDERAVPTQDPRVELQDEGPGGAQLYGSTGSSVSSVHISGNDGKVRVTAPETIVGAEGAAKALANEDLVTWVLTELIPKLGSYTGSGPITVTPPTNVTTTKLRGE